MASNPSLRPQVIKLQVGFWPLQKDDLGKLEPLVNLTLEAENQEIDS